MQIAVNYLAPFTLTNLLLAPLRAAAPARIVTVVSDAFSDTRQVKILPRPRPGQLDVEHLDDLAHLNPSAGFDPLPAYARAGRNGGENRLHAFQSRTRARQRERKLPGAPNTPSSVGAAGELRMLS